MDSRPKVLIACDRRVRQGYLPPTELERLEALADWEWFECTGGDIYDIEDRPEKTVLLGGRMGEVDALVVCHGAPRIDAALMDRAPRLKFIGELEGDRFAARIDLEAAWSRGIRTVDTTNGSSYPVAEWALGLVLISLRNAGAHFRRIIAGIEAFDPEPIPADSEIIHLDNVFLSPHFGGLTGDEYPHFFRLMVGELERFHHGHETWFDLTPRSWANRRGEDPG